MGFYRNAQRKLLTYFLKQISLFSNIDESTVDISLGTNSTFTFTDVDLMVDELELPYLAIKSGRIEALTVQLGISGNVEIIGTGIHFASCCDQEDALLCGGMSHNTSDTSRDNLFSIPATLAQSIQALTDSISASATPSTGGGSWEGDETVFSGATDEIEDDASSNRVDGKRQLTTFGTLKNKIRSAMLSNVTVTLFDIKFSVADGDNEIVCHLELDKCTLLGNNTCWQLNMAGLKVVRPNIGSLQRLSTLNNHSYTSNHQDNGIQNGEDKMAETQLSDSIYFSKLGETSIYMSALDEPLDTSKLMDGENNGDNRNDNDSSLFELDEMRVSFVWLSTVGENQVTDLCVDIDNLKINVDGILESGNPQIMSILKCILSRNSGTITPNVEQRDRLNSKEESSASDILETSDFLSFLSYVLVQNSEILLTENLKVKLTKTSINRLETGECQIRVDTFGVESRGQEIFNQSSEERPIILIQLSEQRYTMEILRDISFLLSQDTLRSIIQVSCKLQNLFQYLKPENSGPLLQTLSGAEDFSTLQVTTRNVKLNLVFAEFQYSVDITPLTYESGNRPLQCSSISISKSCSDEMNEVLSFESITFQRGVPKCSINAFADTLKDFILKSARLITFEKFKIQGDLESLVSTCHDISSLITLLNRIIDTTKLQPAGPSSRSVNIGHKGSQRVTPSRPLEDVCEWVVVADIIEWEISNLWLVSGFGKIRGVHESSLLAVVNDGKKIVFNSKSLFIDRINCDKGKKISQSIVSQIGDNNEIKPSLLLKMNTSGDSRVTRVYLRNIAIHYYAKWMDFIQEFENLKRYESPSSDDICIESDKSTNAGNRRKERDFSIDVMISNSSIFLFPYRIHPSLLVVVDDLTFHYIPQSKGTSGILRSATLMMIDDVAKRRSFKKNPRVSLLKYYSRQGFAMIGKLGRTKISHKDLHTTPKLVVLTEYLELALCPDSFHTLVQLCSDLKYPESFPDDEKFRFQPSKVKNIFDEIDPDFFNPRSIVVSTSEVNAGYKEFFQESSNLIENFIDSAANRRMEPTYLTDTSVDNLNLSCLAEPTVLCGSQESLFIQNGYIDSVDAPQSGEANGFKMNHTNCNLNTKQKVILTLHLDVEQISIKLYDGFDWRYSRAEIEKAIKNLERGVDASDAVIFEDGRYSSDANPPRVVGKSLFDSIFITAKVNDPSSLKNSVDREVQSGPYHTAQADSNVTLSLHPSRSYKVEAKAKMMKLELSIFDVEEKTEETTTHKPMVISDMTLLVNEFDLIDNVPTSTWNKFLTQELRTKHLPILTFGCCLVRPTDYLKATEFIFNFEISPLRLHVDQDTLDFMLRFLSFKDPRFELIDKYPELPFIQRLTINPVELTLDFKPKKVENLKVRSTYASKLMSFFVLDGASIELAEVSLHGLSGFGDLGSRLFKIWAPDVTKNQVYGVLGGVAPLKSVVTLGSDVKTFAGALTEEYRVNGTISSGLRRNGHKFLKSTAGNLVNFGAKIVTGTQNILEGTEGMLGGKGSSTRTANRSEDIQSDDDTPSWETPWERRRSVQKLQSSVNPFEVETTAAQSYARVSGNRPKRVSLYANQPQNVQEGLGDAYTSLGKHMNIAYRAIKSARIKFDQGDNVSGKAALASVAKVTPIVVIRPLIGATEALSKTLQGLSNQIDNTHIEEIREKYKGTKSY